MGPLAGLRNSNNIVTSQDGGDAVGLNRSWELVLAQLDVLKHDGVKSSILELSEVSKRFAMTFRLMLYYLRRGRD
jgi:hypothetical protein